MLEAFSPLAFPAVIGLAGWLAIRTFEENSTKIATAFGGLSALKNRLSAA